MLTVASCTQKMPHATCKPPVSPQQQQQQQHRQSQGCMQHSIGHGSDLCTDEHHDEPLRQHPERPLLAHVAIAIAAVTRRALFVRPGERLEDTRKTQGTVVGEAEAAAAAAAAVTRTSETDGSGYGSHFEFCDGAIKVVKAVPDVFVLPSAGHEFEALKDIDHVVDAPAPHAWEVSRHTDTHRHRHTHTHTTSDTAR